MNMFRKFSFTFYNSVIWLSRDFSRIMRMIIRPNGMVQNNVTWMMFPMAATTITRVSTMMTRGK